MIPPWLAAPLAKWIVAGVAALGACVWCYQAGRDAVQLEWDASLARQAAAALTQVKTLQASREVDIRAHAQREVYLNTKIQTLQGRLANYGKNRTTPCVAPPDSVRLFNDVSGLLDAHPERVPAPAAAAGRSDGSSETEFEADRLLPAYLRAYGDATTQLATLWEKYEGLVQDLRKTHAQGKGSPGHD